MVVIDNYFLLFKTIVSPVKMMDGEFFADFIS